MDSSGMLLLLSICLLSVLCPGQASQEVSSEDFGAQKTDTASEKELIEVMEALLGKMHNRLPPADKRGIPLCGMGDRCAIRLGPRIGKLCDCSWGSNCNSFLLKCI